MTVPSREEAARLLLSIDPPDWHVRHSRAVAEIAGWLALRVDRRGSERRAANGGVAVDPDRRREPRLKVDRGMVEAAALLHDIDKALGPGARGDGPHGEAGARWLAGQGHPELGACVALHPVTLLVDPERAARVLGGSVEARIVAYADKRAGQRLQPMAARFAGWRRRHPQRRGDDGWGSGAAAAAWARALVLEAQVCDLAGCRPGEVRRLCWTAPALALARR